MMQLVFQFVGLFLDVPTRSDDFLHDVDVGDARPLQTASLLGESFLAGNYAAGDCIHVTK